MEPLPAASVIAVPRGTLVVLVGPAGSGKSTFARRHFRATEVLSSDTLRALLTDDEADQRVSAEAFALLHRIAAVRLRLGRMTVVDATNVTTPARRSLLRLAAAAGRPAVAIVFDLPLDDYLGRNLGRLDRVVDPGVVERQAHDLRTALLAGRLAREGFVAVHVLSGPTAIDAARVVRVEADPPPIATPARPAGRRGRMPAP